MVTNNAEIIVTCPHCDSPNLDTDIGGYLSCMDCYWSEEEEEEEYFIRGMTDFYDHCEHGIPIDDDCDDCNKALTGSQNKVETGQKLTGE